MRPIFYDFVSADTLSVLLTWAISLNLILIILFILFSFKSIEDSIKLSKRSLALVFLVFLLALTIRLLLSPRIHEDFYNEWAFMEGAQGMILNGKYGLCFFGDQRECLSKLVIPKHAPGVPLILSLSFILFGVSDQTAIYTNMFYGSASVILVFLVGYLLSQREDVGLYSSLLFALIPLHVKYSGTGLLGPISVFFQLLTATFFLLSLRINKQRMWVLFFLALSYTVQTRPECSLLVLLFAIGYFILKPAGLTRANVHWYHFLVVLLLLPHVVHLANNISSDSWKEGKNISYFSMDHSLRHFAPYIYFWLRADYQLLIFPFLSFFGIFYLVGKEKKIFWFLSLWFIMYLLFFIPYHFNPITSRTPFRYMLSAYVPFSLFMGYGVIYFLRYFSGTKILGAVLVLAVITFTPLISHITYKNPLVLAEMEIMKDVENEIDDRCFVVGRRALFSIQKKFIYPHLLLKDEDAFDRLRSVTDCLYLFQDISASQSGWAEQILKKCPHRIIASREVLDSGSGRPVTLAFYEFDLVAYPK